MTQLLAERLRPSSVHPQRLVGPAARIWNRELKMWREGKRFHIIFWGPPGSGKTTLANMLGEASGLIQTSLSAVRDGVKEIRAAVNNNPGQMIFIDEIHRLSKSQQDVLLPVLENAEAWIVGATTESPRVTLNPAILSRLRTIYVAPPSEEDVLQALNSGLEELNSSNEEDANAEKMQRLKILIESKLARLSGGDVRFALNILESVFYAANAQEEHDILLDTSKAFTSKEHYDLVSAMIKSMRGSDPDAALYYAIAALDSGEDGLFLMRRCVIFASEDVGNADPTALAVAVNAYKAIECVGMPEGRIPLAQAVTYLASTVKSNRAYKAISTVREWRQTVETEKGLRAALEPPASLTIKGKGDYQYPHDFADAYVPFEYLPESVARLKNQHGPAYKPTDFGAEARIRARLLELWKKKTGKN